MTKKILKISALLLILAFGGIQLVRPERTNPASDPAKSLGAGGKLPAEVAAVLNRSCDDCHSNNTEWPWYSNVAPISWSIVDHVNEGREELNFSEWGAYSERRQARKLEEICEEVKEREMPHYQYVWLHRDAALSDAEIRLLCTWTETLRAEDQ